MFKKKLIIEIESNTAQGLEHMTKVATVGLQEDLTLFLPPMLECSLRQSGSEGTAGSYLIREVFVEPTAAATSQQPTAEGAFLYPKVIILCRNAEGAPEFHACSPEVTQEQIDDGDHYDLAKENAAFNGYSEPMLAFDATDPAAKGLEKLLDCLGK